MMFFWWMPCYQSSAFFAQGCVLVVLVLPKLLRTHFLDALFLPNPGLHGSSWVFMGLHWTGQGSERMALSKGEYNPIIGFPHHHKIIMYFPGVIPVTLTFWQFLTHRSIAHDYWWLYTCIFQRAWSSAWPQISACGGNWKLRRKVILSIFWGILIRSWWTIQVKRNALSVMFAFFFLVLKFYVCFFSGGNSCFLKQ